jgi:cold shock CspA family protein
MSEAETMKGVVAHYQKVRGFGFIACNEPAQRFYHISDVVGHLRPVTGDVVSIRCSQDIERWNNG